MSFPFARPLVVACSLAAVALPPASAHAAGWQPLGHVSTSAADELPQVAFDADGNGVMAWSASAGGGTVVRAATRPAGGDWSAPQTLTAAQASRYVTDVEIAMGPDGTAFITWARDYDNPGNEQIQYAEAVAGGAIGAAQPLPGGAGSGGDFASEPTVLFGPGGGVTVVHDYDPGFGTEGGVRVTSRSAEGTWGTPVDISDPSALATDSTAAFDADGDLTVAWREGYFEDPNTIRTKTRPAGGAWPADADNLTTTANSNSDGPRLVVAPDGRRVVAWQQDDGSSDQSEMHTYAAVHDGDDWATTDLTPAGEEGADELEDPRLAVESDGTVTLVARHRDVSLFESRRVLVARRMAGSATTFAAPHELSEETDVIRDPDVAVSSGDELAVVWRDGFGRIAAARHEAGSGWTSEETVIGSEGDLGEPSVAHDEQGNVGVAFVEDGVASMAVYDQTAPELGGVSVPAAAVAGATVTVSATATDDWLPAEPHWAFGEALAHGSPLFRSFAAGRTEVHVAAIDAAGNASESVVRSIDVTAPVTSNPGGGGTTTTPVTPPPAPTPPKPAGLAPSTPAATVITRLLGGKPGKLLGDLPLGSAQVYAPDDVGKGRITIGGKPVPLFALVARQDTTITGAMALQNVPAPARKASAAAARSVKLETQVLRLKAGQSGALSAKLSAAQRKLVKRGKGKVRLVVTITAKDATGKATKATKKLKVAVR